jgi:hypothetical protein
LTAVCTGVASARSTPVDDLDHREVLERGQQARAYMRHAALRMWSRANAAFTAQPRAHRVVIQRMTCREITDERVLDLLPCQRGRTRAGRGIDHLDAHLHGELPALEYAFYRDRIVAPPAVLAAQGGPTEHQREARAQQRAVRKVGVRLQESAQRATQRALRERLGQRAIHAQIQARHVDAAYLGPGEVHGRAHARRHRDVPGRAREPQRHRNLVHADPIETPCSKRARFLGDIGHRPHDIHCHETGFLRVFGGFFARRQTVGRNTIEARGGDAIDRGWQPAFDSLIRM